MAHALNMDAPKSREDTMAMQSSSKMGMLVVLVPFLAAAKGKGCGGDGDGPAIFSSTPAPDMSGTWDVTYDDRIDVEITIGGAVYTAEIGVEGGSVTIDHDGQPITFDLDCARPEVVCPTEVWPAEVSFRQDDPNYPHRVWMQIPTTECSGMLVEPDPSTCGPETNNPDCAEVCDGESVTTTKEAFGTVDEGGDDFWVGLDAKIASNGVNCLLIGGSIAQGALETTGSAETEDWDAVAADGDVVTVYAGGCLWAGDPNMDGELEALVLGGSVRFATGFSGSKQ
jgi:hypothetical protein